ncbi:MAG: AmmeMemoRadiSam system radical SAM enzyme [Candidatus Aureabacteria bacterium]|nr:AmmeMemoRadiSam system radical SAM enzyme [Candidatus Auribacterota bacterium]
MKKALFYKEREGGRVQCDLCSHRCVISPGKRGVCGVRENRDGVLYSLVYGKAAARNVDPIEKKPLFHFYPGSKTYSIATVGCNFRCLYCQNWQISQLKDEVIIGEEFAPEDIVEDALSSRCESIAYTYTEPTIFYEYAFDTAIIAQKKGLKNLFITNGYITEEALREISPYLDTVNIDLKSMSDDFYKKVCSARLKPVLDNITLCYSLGIWVEVTTLVIPGYNDSLEELREIAMFIRSINKSIPWHVSRFFPAYQLNNVSLTPLKRLEEAVKIGREAGLEYVYQGNMDEGENTFCPNCGKLLIIRTDFNTIENKIKDGSCPYCRANIVGVHMKRKRIEA